MKLSEDYIPFKCEFIDDVSRVDESAQSEVAKSGGTILAIVKGQHFCPGKVSRNHRLYTEELWEAASKDEDVIRKLVILTREAGYKIEQEDVENTILRAGTTMYVSSRADGDYEGKDEDGNDILDPKTYKLERFDFVQDPGFLDAKPKMITESKKDEDMKEAIGEKVAESLLSLAMDLEVPLELDGATYSVEKVCESKVDMSNCDTQESDSYNLGDFTEVTEDMRKCIVEHFNEQQKELEDARKELDEANKLIKTLRFANSKGLNEDYVMKRVNEGATLDIIEREQPAPQTFKVVEAKIPRSDESSTLLDRILGY